MKHKPIIKNPKTLPKNEEIIRAVGVVHDVLEETRKDHKIDRHGEDIISKTEDILVDAAEILKAKNPENQLQKLIKESQLTYNSITRNDKEWADLRGAIGGIRSNKLRYKVMKFRDDLRYLLFELITSSAFRRDIADLISMLYLFLIDTEVFDQYIRERNLKLETISRRGKKKRRGSGSSLGIGRAAKGKSKYHHRDEEEEEESEEAKLAKGERRRRVKEEEEEEEEEYEEYEEYEEGEGYYEGRPTRYSQTVSYDKTGEHMHIHLSPDISKRRKPPKPKELHEIHEIHASKGQHEEFYKKKTIEREFETEKEVKKFNNPRTGAMEEEYHVKKRPYSHSDIIFREGRGAKAKGKEKVIEEDEETKKSREYEKKKADFYSDVGRPKTKKERGIFKIGSKLFPPPTKKYTKQQVIDQFDKVLRQISERPRARESFETFLGIFKLLQKPVRKAQAGGKEVAMGVSSDSHLRRIIDLSIDLFRSVTNYNPRRMISLIKKIYHSVRSDNYMRIYFKKLVYFIEDQLKHPEKIGTSESRREIEIFYDRGKELMSSKKELTRYFIKLREESLVLMSKLENDKMTRRLRHDIKDLVTLLFLDHQGKFVLKPETLQQLRMVVFVALMQKFRFPLPEIVIDQGDKIWLKLRAAIVNVSEILPNKITAANEGRAIIDLTEYESKGKIPEIDDASRETITIVLKNMNLRIHNADIEFRRNKFPSVHDKGNVNIIVGKRGLDLKLKISVNNHANIFKNNGKVFELTRVDCDLHDLVIELNSTKHDKIYNTLIKVIKPFLKKTIAKNVEDKIRRVLDVINNEIIKRKAFLTSQVKTGTTRIEKSFVKRDHELSVFSRESEK